MDPVSLILAALAAGAATGGQEILTDAVKDAYSALKSLLVKRFAKHSDVAPALAPVDAAAVLAAHEAKPETWQAPLEDALKATGADHDEEILAAARALLAQADPQGSAAGKYVIDLKGATAVQVGDHGHMTVTIGNARSRPRPPR